MKLLTLRSLGHFAINPDMTRQGATATGVSHHQSKKYLNLIFILTRCRVFMNLVTTAPTGGLNLVNLMTQMTVNEPWI